jgi:type IV secretion system protein VirB9
VRTLAAILLLSLPAATASAQDNDDRYRTIDYSADSILQIPTAGTTTQVVLFDRGERIQSIILSDPGAYLVTVAATGDSLSLKQNGRSGPTMMSVRTDARSYELELLAGTESVPQVIRFRYTPSPTPPPSAPVSHSAPTEVSYRLKGSKAVRPVSLRDDGSKTYIAWRDDQPMPAIFALGPSGKEEMVNGYVRAGIFTIDRVYDVLVFRIDREAATARRIVGGTRSK